ncbi:HET-domain-containing protein, partial [Polyplosphaeria fusca]
MLKSIDGDQYFSAERRGWLACFPAQLGSRIWTPRPIPETFAPQLARQWLASCCKHHSNRCRNALARPTNLVVIDCKDLVVVPCPDAPYVALSYVWGSDRDEETGNTLAEYDLRKPSNTVKDAIDITTRMGYRYLWVDQFCINQSNVNIQREQIERMDMVYQGAYFTIVAAAGEDQRHGIAGASAKRKHQFVLNNGDVTVIEMPPETPYESVWSTRAWTFQEGLLSPRRLLFTETHAFFICRESYCSE